MARRLPPFRCEITHLGPRGVGVGVAPDGRPVHVRGAPPGALLDVAIVDRSKGVWHARRLATVRPAPGAVTPRCAQFGTCGGCLLQELALPAQRAAKHALVLAEVGPLDGVAVHPPRGADEAYGYRNKVELSFGPRQWLPEAGAAPVDGRFLGFHAPGRFDRVVDAPRCDLVSEPTNALLAAVRAVALAPDAPPPYDPRTGAGYWRHLLLREARGRRIAVLYTASAEPAEPAERAAEALVAAGASGVEWRINAGKADVARGEVARTWGTPVLEERLGDARFRLSPTAFFQTSTAGAEVLYATVGEALGEGLTLLDLYCGIGAIGLALHRRFARIVGIEENAEAVADARANAALCGVEATFRAARVEDALDALAEGAGVRIVVDPPRAGLHPDVTSRLAALAADRLVYVACNPASLGRDRVALEAGGWRLTDLWTVDLFPQTGHVEAVASFVRDATSSRS